ncbi:MAG: ParB/RepB/Spo0J family partition protein [Chlamydiales bacterium]|nr:ParB/RepB/Spo0J family partition protein [Chlamydiales bacterium]
MNETICEVEWDTIRVSPFQPRKEFSEEELDELAASIKAVGLIHPPVVRAIKSGEKVLYYELIAGERRWRASKRAGLSKLKVLLRDSNDQEAAKQTLIENVQRVDLDPLEMALAFKKLIDTFRMTQEEVADRVGKKRSTVANYLRLLTLPERVKSTLSGKKISMGHAKAILSLDSEELQTKLHDLIVDSELTVRQAEATSVKLSKRKRKKGSDKDPHILEMEQELEEKLKRKVEIQHHAKGAGTITLHYYDLDDLDNLLSYVEML